MRKSIFTIAILINALISSAQYDIKVKEGSANLGGASHNSFTVYVQEANKKEVEKALKSAFKDFKGKIKMDKEIFVDDAKMKAMGDNTFDVYATVKELDKGIEIATAVDLGGSYLNSKDHSSQAKAYKDWLYNFAVETTKEALKGMAKEAEDVLKEKEKEQEKLEKEKEKLEKDIADYEKAIEKAKEDIKSNEKDQTKKKEEIKTQTTVVSTIKEKEKAVK